MIHYLSKTILEIDKGLTKALKAKCLKEALEAVKTAMSNQISKEMSLKRNRIITK